MQFESTKPHFIRREKSSSTSHLEDLFLNFGQKDEDKKKISSDEKTGPCRRIYESIVWNNIPYVAFGGVGPVIKKGTAEKGKSQRSYRHKLDTRVETGVLVHFNPIPSIGSNDRLV